MPTNDSATPSPLASAPTPHERVVAVAARELLERALAARLHRHPDLLDPLARPARRLQMTGEQLGGSEHAPPARAADVRLALDQREQRRQLGRGSAWAMLPTIVPRDRIAGCATCVSTSASSGRCSTDKRRALRGPHPHERPERQRSVLEDRLGRLVLEEVEVDQRAPAPPGAC